MRRIIPATGLAALILLFASSSYANNCNIRANQGLESHSVSFGNVTVQRDMPVGAIIATVLTGDYSVMIECRNRAVYREELSKWKTLSPLGDRIYNTNLPGVGIRIWDVYWGGKAIPFDLPHDYAGGGAIGPYRGYKVELIKTREIQGGVLESGTLVRGSIANEFYFSDVVLNGTNIITPVACSVTIPDINVALGQRKKSEFNGVGSVSPWQDFTVDLNCNKNARINIRIDANGDTSAGGQGVMQLDKEPGDMAAQGIGIQLGFRSDASMVQFGQEKVYMNTSPGGRETIPLRARYYQTATKITAGIANGTATFTLTYK